MIFDKADEVVAGITSFAKQNGLAGSHLTAIGAFSDVTLGYFQWETKDYHKLLISEQSKCSR